MLRAGSVPELWRCGHGFYHGNGPLVWRPENAHLFRCVGDLQRPLFITPMSTAKKPSYTCRQIHWILVPDRKKSCFTLHPRHDLMKQKISVRPVLLVLNLHEPRWYVQLLVPRRLRSVWRALRSGPRGEGEGL